jgi:hypothetical protein
MRGYDSNWYLFDDSIVKLSDPEKWTSSQADPYILFYYNVASQNVIKKDEPKIKGKKGVLIGIDVLFKYVSFLLKFSINLKNNFLIYLNVIIEVIFLKILQFKH